MKVRDSGIPEEAWWSTFFDPERILRVFGRGGGRRVFPSTSGKGST
ncbi:MAG: hypothetical protein NUW14_10770 [Deltaproteobacteria bacterium]|nr:hypothetical protein [Deltaproteobacteria bacterium]